MTGWRITQVDLGERTYMKLELTQDDLARPVDDDLVSGVIAVLRNVVSDHDKRLSDRWAAEREESRARKLVDEKEASSSSSA